MNPGDKVYIVTSNNQYFPGTVEKVTPSGMVDISWGEGGRGLSRFRNGRRVGDSKWHSWRIDDEKPFAERTAWILDYNRHKEAENMLRQLPPLSAFYGCPSTAALLDYINKIEVALKAARELLEKCK